MTRRGATQQKSIAKAHLVGMVEAGAHIEIGQIPYPGKAELHPSHAEVTAADHDWLRATVPFANNDSMETFISQSIPRWSCWVYPTAQRARIGAIARMYTLLSTLDDRAISDPDTYDGFMRLLDGGGATSSPYAAAYNDVWSRLTGAMSDGVRSRYLPTQQRWAEGLAAENALRATGYMAYPDVCYPIRLISSGCETIMVPIEHGLGVDLTNVMATDADLAGMWRIAGEHVVLVNDLFSVRKEAFSGDGMNLLLSLMHHDGMTLQAAVDVVLKRIRKADEEYIRMCRTLRSRYDHRDEADEVSRYLDGLGFMMAGNVAWHYEAIRYHGMNHTWNGKPPTVLVLYPDRTEFVYEQDTAEERWPQ